MGSILGLIDSADLSANRSNNARRNVFYDYPNGKFPLTGLLSLMEDEEALSDSKFAWYEEQWKSVRSVTAAVPAGGVGPFASSVGVAYGADITIAAGGSLIVYAQDVSTFRVRDVMKITKVTTTTPATTEASIILVVTVVDTVNNYIVGKLAEGISTVKFGTSNNGLFIFSIGTATGEGDSSRSDGNVKLPTRIENFTQIFRTVVGPFTGTALKQGQIFDQSGMYRKSVKDNALVHMEKMEKSMFFGVRTEGVTQNKYGDNVPIKTLGGIEWFLRQYEIGNTGNGGAFDYRPGETDITTSSWTTEELKRVIRGIGTITSSQWEELIRRMFYSQSDKGFEKLVICGDKTLAVINAWAKAQSMAIRELNAKDDTYGLKITQISTVHGDLLFKTHPLFKEVGSGLGDTMFVLDMGDIKYHALDGRDTELLKNRQNRDDDFRKDEWITECTQEFRHPLRHMLISGLTGIRN